MFHDDEMAGQWLEKNIWPDGRKCPKCRHDGTAPTKNSRMPYRYSGCNKRFSVRTGTIMAHSHVSYRNWVITVYCWPLVPRAYLACSCTAIWGSSRAPCGSCCTRLGSHGTP